MKKTILLYFVYLLGGCTIQLGTQNAIDTMASRPDQIGDLTVCGGGVGIDNRVGLALKAEANKRGGELSAQQSSEIRAKAMSEGLMTGDEKNMKLMSAVFSS